MARGHRNIWQGRPGHFRNKFRCSCERLRLRLASNNTIVSAYVFRNSDSYAFEKACIQIGDDADTTEFFSCLEHAVGNEWEKAAAWDKFPVEVALISGDEMEARAKETVTIKAIDDYGQEGVGSGWLQDGDPRNLVWLKCVLASLKGATVQRIFLVDSELLRAEAKAEEREVLELFKTTALQHKFLTEKPDGRQRGEIRVVKKNPALFDHKGDRKWVVKQNPALSDHEGHRESNDQWNFPDYWISIANDGGAKKIEGGVALYPVARYLHAGDTEWEQLFDDLWNQGEEFPKCFSSVATVIKTKFDQIHKDMLERNELYPAGEEKEAFGQHLSVWLKKQLDSI